MYRIKTLAFCYRRWRGRIRRMRRIIYMSPAEARFVILMGGKVITFKRFKHRKNGFPVTIVLSLGKYLKSENFKREVRYGKYFVDFANDVDRIIEIDGWQYHMDVVADFDREIAIKTMRSDAKFLRIPAFRMNLEPARVQQEVLEFMYK